MANQAVYGIVKTREQAERIVQALLNASIRHEDISFLSQHNESASPLLSGQERTQETMRNWRNEERLTDYPAGTTQPGQYQENVPGSKTKSTRESWGSNAQAPGGLGAEKHSKAPEGAATGGITGGIIGGVLGLLAGIGALAIPGAGPFIAAGPLMATLSGLGAGGTIGGIIGALIGAGIPEHEAERYENRLKEGGILIAVRTHSDELAQRVKEIMKQHGAEHISISSEAYTSKNYKAS